MNWRAPNQITSPNAGGRRPLQIRTSLAARVGEFLRSVKSITTISVLACVLVFSSCSGRQSDAILGTWQTEVVPSEWGTNRIMVTYHADGRMFGTNDFLGGSPLSWHGTYRVRGSIVQRTIEGRTEEIAYSIAGDTMHMRLGDEDYTFTRMITEPDGPVNGSQLIRSETNSTSSSAGSRR